MMLLSTRIQFKGLFIGLAILAGVQVATAQVVPKSMKDATNVVTDPLKDVQSTTKGVTEPMKDVQKGIKTVTEAPREVTRELDRTEKSIENVGKEAERTSDQAKRLAGTGDKNKTGSDSAKIASDGKTGTEGKTGSSADNQAPQKYVPANYVPEKKSETVATSSQPGVDPNDVPRPVPPGSRDNKTPSGPMPAMEAAVPDLKVDPDPGVAPENAAAAGEKYVSLTESSSQGEKRVRPDYSNSHARIALEKADYDIETLEDLFKYSNWEGPEREHTVRAVEYSLNELQQAIVEIKKLDPGYSTWRFEERYKEMRTAFQKAKQI